MKIRKMKINDYEYVRKLYNQLYLSHLNARPDIYLKDVESFNFEYFVEQLNNKNTINLVYEDNDGIVAILLANYKKPSKAPFIRKRKVIFIDSLVVDEFHKKMGIGRRMMEYIENIGKKKKVESIELNVYAFNKDAIKFYKSLGMSKKSSIYEKHLNNKSYFNED